ncbi:MAG: zinc ribbon domain-containing protein [Oscillospiraceae bacterium]|nr:zinc ribbon domain-containing protein [Oscillospiraceae bacterium]
MTFCTKCGAQLDGATKFCEKCGQVVAVPSVAQPAPVVPRVAPKAPKKSKGLASKIFGVALAVVAVVLLNYLGVPGYVAALLFGVLGACSLLRQNQNGKAREKLALTGAAIAGIAVYIVATGPLYGAYFGALVFLAIGFGLTRLYKQKPGFQSWLLEVVPVALFFCLFERVGGAVSGIPGVFGGNPMFRYAEALVFLVAFLITESLHLKKATQVGREKVITKHTGLRDFGKIFAVISLVLIWFNPFSVLVFDNIKNNVYDLLAGFGEEKSVVSVISDTNGTALLQVSQDNPVTSEAAALELLSQYDKELGGEYAFIERQELPSGNSLYQFAQMNDGIAIENGAKNLVVDADGTPLYAVGQTKIISKNLTVPKKEIGAAQAKKTIQSYFDDTGATVGDLQKVWHYAELDGETAYRFTYAAAVQMEEENFSVLLDAISGEIMDISYTDNELDAVLQNAKLSGKFEDADFESITKSTAAILLGTQINAWRYRDVLEQECLAYYTHKGDEKLGKSNARAFVKAFESAGAKGSNADEGVVSVAMKNSRTAIKGTINFAYDSDDIMVAQSDGRQYTIKTAVPITLTVTKANGEPLLTLPVFDEEIFEIYPTGQAEQYIFTVQGGSRFQSTAKSSFAPVLPGMITASAADDSFERWAEGEANASYALTIEQLGRSDNNASSTVYQLLQKIENAYNDSNGARYISLYRFDDVGKMAEEQVVQPMEQLGAEGAALANMIKPFYSPRWLSVVAHTYLIGYRAANEMIAPIWKGVMAKTAQAVGGDPLISDDDIDKLVSDDPDKTAIIASLLVLNGELDYFNSITNPNNKNYGLLNRLNGTNTVPL